MLAGSESIQVFKNRLNEHLSEVVQMKQSCLRNKGFGMETKLFNILSLPSTPKYIVLLVCSTHFQENQNSFIQASVSQIATSPQIQCDLPLCPQPSCYNSPCTLLS